MIDSHEFFQNRVQEGCLKLLHKGVSKRFLCNYFNQYLNTIPVPTICIIGGSGSGKSTLALDMAKCLKAELIQEEGYHINDRKWRRARLYETKDPHSVIDYVSFKSDIKTITTDPANVLSLPKYNPLNGIVVWNEFRKNKIKALIVEGANKGTLKLTKFNLSIYLHTSDTERYLTRMKRGGRGDRLLMGERLLQEFLKRQEIEHIPSTLPCMKKTDVVLYRHADPISWEFTYDLYRRC